MRSSQENPVRSHSLVLQGCAGEESRNGGAVLMLTYAYIPDLFWHFLELRVVRIPYTKQACSLSSVWEILKLEPSLTSPLENSF